MFHLVLHCILDSHTFSHSYFEMQPFWRDSAYFVIFKPISLSYFRIRFRFKKRWFPDDQLKCNPKSLEGGGKGEGRIPLIFIKYVEVYFLLTFISIILNFHSFRICNFFLFEVPFFSNFLRSLAQIIKLNEPTKERRGWFPYDPPSLKVKGGGAPPPGDRNHNVISYSFLICIYNYLNCIEYVQICIFTQSAGFTPRVILVINIQFVAETKLNFISSIIPRLKVPNKTSNIIYIQC